MLVIILAILAVLIGVFGPKATPEPWSDPDLGQAVEEGAADARHLWLLGTNDVLVRFNRQTGERSVVGRDVFDLQQDGDRLWAVSRAEGSPEVSFSDLKDPERRPIKVNVEGDLVGLFATGGDRPGLLTNRQVMRPAGDGWRHDRLAAELKCGEFPASYGFVGASADGQVYLGCDVGEWGGGLQRIDPATGKAVVISQGSGEACGGLINPNCDPVVGVFPDSEQPNCMTVGTSLAHMSLRDGQILRVCGDTITRVFSAPLPSFRPDYPQSWAFDGFVPTHDGWVAFSRRRYARSRSGSVEMRPTPALKDWSGLRISDEQDGVLFVLESCCHGYVDHPTEFRVLAVPVEPSDPGPRLPAS